MGQKYTIYSKVSDKDAEDSNIDKGWHTITVDLKSALSDDEFNPQKFSVKLLKLRSYQKISLMNYYSKI